METSTGRSTKARVAGTPLGAWPVGQPDVPRAFGGDRPPHRRWDHPEKKKVEPLASRVTSGSTGHDITGTASKPSIPGAESLKLNTAV